MMLSTMMTYSLGNPDISPYHSFPATPRLPPHFSSKLYLSPLAISKSNGRKGSEGLMIIKLDMEKAYDRTEWGLINHVLSFFEFSVECRRLIMHRVSSPRISVLLDGGKLEQFLPSHLQQLPHPNYFPQILFVHWDGKSCWPHLIGTSTTH